VPLDNFYEWQKTAAGKQPYAIGLKGGGMMSTYRVLAACYTHLRRLDEARGIIKRLRAIVPVLVPDVSYLRNPKQRELYLSGSAPGDGRTGIAAA
jgi:hypothetical protein